jgi:hypothetical protein
VVELYLAFLAWEFAHRRYRQALEQTRDREELRRVALMLLDANLGQRRFIRQLLAQSLSAPAPHQG